MSRMSPPEASTSGKALPPPISIREPSENTLASMRLDQGVIAVVEWPTLEGKACPHPAKIDDGIINIAGYSWDLEGRSMMSENGEPKMLAYRTWAGAWTVLDPRVSALLNKVDDIVEGA